MHNAIRSAILYALNDGEGQNLDTYEALVILGGFLPDYGTPIFDRVEVTRDGRYYLTQEAYDELVDLLFG
jgi:hypothetical protein